MQPYELTKEAEQDLREVASTPLTDGVKRCSHDTEMA